MNKVPPEQPSSALGQAGSPLAPEERLPAWAAQRSLGKPPASHGAGAATTQHGAPAPAPLLTALLLCWQAP